ERKAAEAARETALAEARQLAHQRSEFLAQMSHELRTPLNGILGFAQILQRDKPLTERQARGLKIIDESGQHLLTLINDILELSKIEAGRAVLQTEVLNPQDMLQEVMDMVSMRAGQSGVALVLDSAGLPAAARVDGTKLRQVLLNLMSNAVKFTSRGKVTLRARGAARGACCELSFAVIDTGPGIAEADQARIFEPFIQADGPGAKEGTGLGLTISREFVQLMGGTLSVQSVPGAGSIFQFTVTTQLAGAPALAAGHAAAGPAADEQGHHIVVVDERHLGGAPLALPAPLSRADVACLSPQLRATLRAAVQELNLVRVAQLLAPVAPELGAVVERIEHMVSRHQYPQLCALLEEDGPALAPRP
ncbi:MAG TPA: ATP-binding protein, partial [Burkholderiaceae bacterium]|nr:ATP-binding protein [Burkholderiaceae bacterium]